MKLYEYEGKSIFRQYGIKTAKGWLLHNLPNNIHFPVIAKTQVLTGGRGKLGGIQKVSNESELKTISNNLLNMTIKDEKVADVYIEEIVSYEKEFYISIAIDRNKKAPVLIVSDEGGVDIEEVPKEKILLLPINPLIGLQPYMIRKVELFFNDKFHFVSDLLEKMWRMFKEEQAELIEINPLFIQEEGNYIAGDAKVILDSSANRRSVPIMIERNNDSFEAKCSVLNTVGVELEGDIAVITSGAGLGMATFDLVSNSDLSVRALVDLGGHAIHDIEIANRLIDEIKMLQPKAFLFNFYFQVASCLVLAQAIENQLGNSDIPVIVRLKGQDEEQAVSILSKYSHIFATDKIQEAVRQISKTVREVTL